MTALMLGGSYFVQRSASNDFSGVEIADRTDPSEVRAAAESYSLTILSINALYWRV